MPARTARRQLPARPRGRRAPLPRYAVRALGAALAAVLVAASAQTLGAQAAHDHGHDAGTMSGMTGMPGMGADAADRAAHDDMSGHLAASAHMHMTPRTTPLPGDAARAAAIADTLRRAIAKYRDTTAAVADGYRMFAPRVKDQHVFHFTSRRNAIRNQFGFAADRPTSLLYERAADGRFVLVGAMYTAPNSASMADLNARVPLGIAQWHQHVNLCVPRLGALGRWSETEDGRPVFGPLSPIATKAECDAVDGRFHERVFNWMVHVRLDGPDPWRDEH